MDLTDLLKEKFLIWISKNRSTFFLVVLLVGNAYQYMDRVKLEQKEEEDKKKLNEQIQQINRETLQYERVRSEKLEFLLSNLDKHLDDGSQHKALDNR